MGRMRHKHFIVVQHHVIHLGPTIIGLSPNHLGTHNDDSWFAASFFFTKSQQGDKRVRVNDFFSFKQDSMIRQATGLVAEDSAPDTSEKKGAGNHK